jgi:hypothetical protein
MDGNDDRLSPYVDTSLNAILSGGWFPLMGLANSIEGFTGLFAQRLQDVRVRGTCRYQRCSPFRDQSAFEAKRMVIPYFNLSERASENHSQSTKILPALSLLGHAVRSCSQDARSRQERSLVL